MGCGCLTRARTPHSPGGSGSCRSSPTSRQLRVPPGKKSPWTWIERRVAGTLLCCRWGRSMPANATTGRVLVPLDGSEQSAAILALVAKLRRRLHAAVELLHVLEALPPATSPDLPLSLADASPGRPAANDYLERVAARFDGESPEVARRARRSGGEGDRPADRGRRGRSGRHDHPWPKRRRPAPGGERRRASAAHGGRTGPPVESGHSSGCGAPRPESRGGCA